MIQLQKTIIVILVLSSVLFTQSTDKFHQITYFGSNAGGFNYLDDGIVHIYSRVDRLAKYMDKSQKVYSVADGGIKQFVVEEYKWKKNYFEYIDCSFSDELYSDNFSYDMTNGLRVLIQESKPWCKLIPDSLNAKKVIEHDIDGDNKNEIIVAVAQDGFVVPPDNYTNWGTYNFGFYIIEESETSPNWEITYFYYTGNIPEKNGRTFYGDLNIMDINDDGHDEILLSHVFVAKKYGIDMEVFALNNGQTYSKCYNSCEIDK